MIVEVEGLTKRFAVRRPLRELFHPRREHTAVDGVSFSAEAGRTFGLLGQNGAGKTTLFKMLATLVLPDAGRASIDGHDVRRAPQAVRELIAPVMANDRTLNWRLSALENLRLYAALQGLGGAAAREECARVLALAGLDVKDPRMVGQFSTGMRQRLLIARALLTRPRVLLLDEPTRSLDPISARDLRRFLRETVVGAEGCTVLLATHDADEVWDLCDRVAVLDRGRLLAVDATRVMRERASRDHYRAWVRREQSGAAITAASAAGIAFTQRGAALEEGWDELECILPEGADAAARVLATLGGAGIAVARFERAAPSIAELIERVVASRGEAAHA